MKISEVARETGLTTKTIRYYESIGLVPEPSRGTNGYRQYGARHLAPLRLLGRARKAGFSLEECEQLVRLLSNPHRQSADVKATLLDKVERIEQQIKELTAMRDSLLQLSAQCAGDACPECGILDSLTAPLDEEEH